VGVDGSVLVLYLSFFFSFLCLSLFPLFPCVSGGLTGESLHVPKSYTPRYLFKAKSHFFWFWVYICFFFFTVFLLLLILLVTEISQQKNMNLTVWFACLMLSMYVSKISNFSTIEWGTCNSLSSVGGEGGSVSLFGNNEKPRIQKLIFPSFTKFSQ
jgi:hypothetical protein